jgi:hypothetical protein
LACSISARRLGQDKQEVIPLDAAAAALADGAERDVRISEGLE